jgi:hypothetical protein
MVTDYFGVTIPDIQICPNHTTPWRAFADAFFGTYSTTVWKASRGLGGKSFLLALLGVCEAAALAADVNVLGGSGEQSNRVHNYMRTFWEHPGAPANLLVSDPTKRETRLEYGNVIQALLASQTSVRGPHPQRLRLDEVDEMELSILDAATGQTMGLGDIPSQTVMSSTHQYPNGTMTEVLRRAKEKGWPVYEWCYKESMGVDGSGWLREEDVDRKRTDVTDAMWRVEYELQDPKPADPAIMTDKVEEMFDRRLGEYDDTAHSGLLIFEEYDRTGKYVTSADWARKRDKTSIQTWRYDCTPIRLVAYQLMNKRPWPALVGAFDERIDSYSFIHSYPHKGIHDQTGLGDVVAGYIVHDGIIGVEFTQRIKADTLSSYVNAIERNLLIAPYIKSMYLSHVGASVNDIYGTGHPPDTIVAGALAYLVIKNAISQSTSIDHLDLGHIEDFTSQWA